LAQPQSEADLVILPDVDCLANRALDDAVPANVGMVVTHKGPKFERRINNLAYVRDRSLGIGFLHLAYEVLETWPLERREWGGDQDAWGVALGSPASWMPLGDERWTACTGAGVVDVYPCLTHNCPLPDDGKIRRRQREAYFVHLKGPRKKHLEYFLKERFA
jgi:hypothetical protein